MNQHAQQLFCTLQKIFATTHQKASFRALVALFLHGDGRPHLRHSPNNSSSALSRFLNPYAWSARGIIRQARHTVIQSVFKHYRHQKGRRPRVLVIIDLTTLEKTGRFQKLDLVRILNKKRGVITVRPLGQGGRPCAVVVRVLVVGLLRVPWSFRLWR